MPNTAMNTKCKAQPNDNLRCNNHCHSFKKVEIGSKDGKFIMNENISCKYRSNEQEYN